MNSAGLDLRQTREDFSHNEVCDSQERRSLEARYHSLLCESDRFNRRIVSFQANKTETLHSWFKFREGFSAELVETLLAEFGLGSGQTVLDPFAGSCTTLLVAKMHGCNSAGIELLPHCHLAWEAKKRVYDYDLLELHRLYGLVESETLPPPRGSFPHLAITWSAFPEENEKALIAYSEWIDTIDLSEDANILFQATLMSILEDISYTRKDGQYLRWDGRAEKIVSRNRKRASEGKKPIRGIDKGELAHVKTALLLKLAQIIKDVQEMQASVPADGGHELIQGNVLHELPVLTENRFDAVITSPPYANRYDYTRTYALELAFLGIGDDIFSLRQEMLSCTVENRPKYLELEKYYETINRSGSFRRIVEIIQSTPVLQEVRLALEKRNARGDINNRGVLGMVEQYFGELAFVFYELFRTCKPGAHVAFVNDNVRYAGEVIPVDLISTQLAETVGFSPCRIYVLPQRKGNSSQQMRKFGRRELRKSITIWRKP